MQQAMGWLGWTPAVFWDATLAELHEALTGLEEIERARAGAKPKPPPVKANDLSRLRELGARAVREERRAARHERKQ